jgi:imidazole glycerol-phosphate synthase subunit HisF
MLAKRIIPCLDILDGRVVKGVRFAGHRDAGDAVELAKKYAAEGADELVFYDITASADDRNTTIDLVRQIAREIFIPFTVGGGIKSVADMRALLLAGADKVSLNTAALENPGLINEGAAIFGSQSIVVGIDSMHANGRDTVFSHTGRVETRKSTGVDTLSWIEEAQDRGAGEIVLNTMNTDGVRDGYDLRMMKKVNAQLRIPLVASGGAGSLNDFAAVLAPGYADAALASSVFHFGALSIAEVKLYLASSGMAVRSPYEHIRK